MKAGIVFDDKDMRRQIAKFNLISSIALSKAVEIGAIQLLTWSANGSEKSSATPPIRNGFLRGSGSVFVGSKHLGNYTGSGSSIDPENMPNGSHNEGGLNITVGYNAKYATRMHEDMSYNPSGRSRSSNGGQKWLEKHLMSDKDLLMGVIATEFKKRAGT